MPRLSSGRWMLHGTGMRNIDVLLYGTMGDIGPVALESLRSHGLAVELIDFPQNVCRDGFGYRRGMMRALQEFAPSVVLPVGHPLNMALYRPSLPEGVSVPIPDEQTIRLLDSKVRSSALAESLGIPQPRMFKGPDGPDSNGNDCAPEPGRTIFKRDRSFGGSGVYRPRTRESLVRLMEHEPGSGWLIEEYVEGVDVSVDCVRTGDFFRAQCYETLNRAQGQGPALERRIVDRPDVVGYAQRILDHVDYRGVCGLDFRVDLSDRALFLECNPRFTGGLRTQIESGFDIPWLLVLRNS